VKVAREPGELERRPRAVAIGTFDGVHRGHRRVLDAAGSAGGTRTVVTFHPHPRAVLGHPVSLLATLERRLELLDEAGVEEVLVVEFSHELAQLGPEAFVEQYLRAIGAEAVAAGAGFRFGHKRRGDLDLLERLGLRVLRVQHLEGVSSTAIRGHLEAGELEPAARLLGRPAEVDGTVVPGEARGARLGFRTANLDVDPDLLVPRNGIYAGAALGHRAAISIGVNPHYGGGERSIEPHILDFEGDLYGRRLVVELWEYLRDEAAFASEEELAAQIARDVEATRRARRPEVPRDA
jgi:riboflavin kinase / FMN adenylyltransferase